MTKDDFYKSVKEQNNATPPAQKDKSGATSAAARPAQPPVPGPFTPKPPFGMPVMPVAGNIKIIKPAVVVNKSNEKEPDIKYPD